MSRIAKQPIEIPNGTDVSIVDGTITIKGPKGTLSRAFRKEISIEKVDNTLVVKNTSSDPMAVALPWHLCLTFEKYARWRSDSVREEVNPRRCRL
jgi:ribosomal protein L6P/L9E